MNLKSETEGGEGDYQVIRRIFSGHRLPVILQSEAAECGLACLAMVSNYFGYVTSLVELRRRFSASLKGTTLKSLMDMGDALGFSSRPVRLELSEISDLKTPAILHWDLKHFVVLRKAQSQALYIHDPALGERKISIEDASRHFTGVALELIPSPAFEKRESVDQVRFADLFSQTRGLTPAIAQLFILALVLQIFSIASPLLNQTVIDDVLGRGDTDLLFTVALGMVILLVINLTVTRLRGYIALYMNTQLSYQLQTNLLRHLLRLPASWFEKRHIGDIISRFSSLSPVQTVMTDAVPAIILDCLMAIFCLIMMLLYSPLLSSIEVATVVVFFGVRLITFPYYRRRQVEGLHLNAQVQSTFLETLRGARTFKAFGRERGRIAVWQNEQASAINNNVRVARFGLWGGVGTGLLAGVQQIVTWYIGAKLVIEGHLTVGMLFACQSYTGQFTGAADRLVGQFFNYRTIGVHLERLADIINSEPEVGSDDPIAENRQFEGGIEVKNLSFRYAENEPWVLKDINLKVAPGEFVCLVGPSGQGKTTLLKLLLGFYEPTEGAILIDGVPMRTFGRRTYRDRIGVVMQDDQLFAGTIADNIAFFDSDIEMMRVEDAARRACIHDDIVRLPMGYLSLVGDMGSILSGGQKQRLFLARALYRNPTVLFLDEGTANLDPENEVRVMATLKSYPGTRIVIAHRDAAVAGADRVVGITNKTIRAECYSTGEI